VKKHSLSTQKTRESKDMSEQEKDFLAYKGNNIPRIIRLVWTIVIVFTLWYLAVNAWPDLKVWLDKVK